MFKYVAVVLAIFGSSAMAGYIGAPIALGAPALAPAAISTSSGIIRSQPALLSAPALAPAPLAIGAPGLLAPRTIISSPALAPAQLAYGAPGLLAPRASILAGPSPIIRSSIW